MSEQEVHEIQLNGKQLVFMFGAAVVVSVVIFLCGVMVGRGVRQPQAELLAASAADIPIESQDPFDTPTARPEASVEPTPAPEREDVTYGNRLEAAVPLDEPLRAVPASKPAVTPAAAEKPAAPPEPAPNTRFAEPPGNGYVVQVGAYPTRADAEAQAGRLGTKGYPTFITLNNDVPRGRYRVRVGKYSNKRDAEAIALRLRQEERLNPWVP